MAVKLTEEPQASPPQRPFEWRAAQWGVLAICAILFFTRLGARALWSSEFRWAEIAREMLRSGNYFWPTINGHLYYDKPLGSYWLVLAANWLTGGLNETAARLPCAIAGLLAVAFLIVLGKRLYDRPVGVLSGAILATSFSFVFFSRHASADVETITGELAALLLFLRNEEHQDGWWIVGLWVIMALTSLTKGLLGFALPALVIGSYCLLAEGWGALGSNLLHGPLLQRLRWVIGRNRWLFSWRSLIAIPLGLALYAVPFWISQRLMHSDAGLAMVYRENVVRFFHPFDHRGPIYLYVYVVFALMAPWSVLLPAALAEVHNERRAGTGPARSDRFILVFFWATFIFFTLSGSRRSYYILPILPAGALLVARLLTTGTERLSRWARRLMVAGFAIVAVIVAFGFLALIPPSAFLRGAIAKMPPAPDRIVFAAMWLIALGTIVYAVANFRTASVALSVFITAFVSMAYIYLFAMPAVEPYRGEKPFAYVVVNQLGKDVPNLGLFRTVGPLFYLDPPAPLPEFDRASDLVQAVKDGRVKWVITRRRDLLNMGLDGTITAAEASFPWESKYQLRNKVVLVKLDSASASNETSAPAGAPAATGASASQRK